VTREDGVDDLGNDRIFVADDSGEERGWIAVAARTGAGGAEFGDEILAKLVFDTSGQAGWGEF
jgi:hypothetical protein